MSNKTLAEQIIAAKIEANTIGISSPICEICGRSLVGITSVANRCSPCFWARSQEQKVKEGANLSIRCAHPGCPFDQTYDSIFCSTHKHCEHPKSIDLLNLKNSALKFDADKLPLDLLPFEALEEIALVLQHGAAKYSRNNWRKGFIHSRPFSAILRHLFAYWKGEDLDKDSGLHHLAHAGCELLFLISFIKTKTGVDDRYQEETKNEPSAGT